MEIKIPLGKLGGNKQLSQAIGKCGEWVTELILNSGAVTGHYKTLHNLYIPYRDNTAEIDLVLIHTKGIYVIESKNYSGWIFGDESNNYWTQCMVNKQRYKFYNPIKQNRTHVNAISNYLKIDKKAFISIILFSGRCELKKVPADTTEYIITQRDILPFKLRYDLNSRNDIFTTEQVDEIAKRLQTLTGVSEQVRRDHVDNIKSNYY